MSLFHDIEEHEKDLVTQLKDDSPLQKACAVVMCAVDAGLVIGSTTIAGPEAGAIVGAACALSPAVEPDVYGL